jgi:hypothetical protein
VWIVELDLVRGHVCGSFGQSDGAFGPGGRYVCIIPAECCRVGVLPAMQI